MDAQGVKIMGNSLSGFFVALAVALLLFILFSQVKSFLQKYIRKRVEPGNESFLAMLQRLVTETRSVVLLAVAFFFGLQCLILPPYVALLLSRVTTFAIFVQMGLWASPFLRFFITKQMSHRESGTIRAALNLLTLIGEIVVWVLVALLVLQNIGIDITALITGLGIGGVAVALAVQSILKDLLASLSIVLDRPFETGDTISIGEYTGTVEKIGLKSTRLRGIDGEELIFSNAALLDKNLKNFRTLRERRMTFTIPISYNHSGTAVPKAIEIVRRLMSTRPKTRLDICMVKGFQEHVVLLEVVYVLTDLDASLIPKVQQEVFPQILKEFQENGITLGPTFPLPPEKATEAA
jgi:MscS family membrane protein